MRQLQLYGRTYYQMINNLNKSSPQIKYKSSLYKRPSQNQENAIKQLACVLNLLAEKYMCSHLLFAWSKVSEVTTKSVRFFACIQNIKTKNLENAFHMLKRLSNIQLTIKKNKQQLMIYPCLLLKRILNQHIINAKRSATAKLIFWKALSNKRYFKVEKISLIFSKFVFRNALSILYRQKISYQLMVFRRQDKQGVLLCFCQRQKNWILNYSFQRILSQSFNQITSQTSQLRIQKRQQKQLYTIKRSQAIINFKNKISQLKAQLQQNQSIIHKKKQYGKYESTIIINKKKQQQKKLQKDLNFFNAQTETLKLALQKKNDSLKQRNLGTIQIQKVFQLFQFINNSSDSFIEIKKNLKGKISQIMLIEFQNCKQFQCLQNLHLQNLLSLYQGRLNQNKGQVYTIASEQNNILKKILSSLVGLQYHRRQNNQSIKAVLNKLQETTSNLKLIKRKNPSKNNF